MGDLARISGSLTHNCSVICHSTSVWPLSIYEQHRFPGRLLHCSCRLIADLWRLLTSGGCWPLEIVDTSTASVSKLTLLLRQKCAVLVLLWEMKLKWSQVMWPVPLLIMIRCYRNFVLVLGCVVHHWNELFTASTVVLLMHFEGVLSEILNPRCWGTLVLFNDHLDLDMIRLYQSTTCFSPIENLECLESWLMGLVGLCL